jgi:hypothetical protein
MAKKAVHGITGGPLFILDRVCVADVHHAVAWGKSELALSTKYRSEAQPG